MILYLFLIPIVSGWGGDGHRIISSLASGIMNDDAVRFLNRALEEEDIATASVWADSLEAETKYPRSGAFHFSNTPYHRCDAFDLSRDCGFGSFKGICIVTGLAEAISRAVDPNVSDAVRADSLKFILHLMADIHQPLHTGFRADSGGVRILLGEPRNTSLHYIWDNRMIEELRRHYSEPVETILKNHLDKNGGRFVAGLRAKINMTQILSSEENITKYVASLASETATTVTCNAGYRDADGHWISGRGGVIDGAYFSARQPVLIVQLLKAAVRLGILIEGISERMSTLRMAEKVKRRVELFSSISTLGPSASIETSNPFGELYIEFDPDSVDERETWVAVPLPKKTVTVGLTVNETKEVEEAIIASETEKNSFVFSEIDISQIRLHVHEGRKIVTNLSLKVYLQTVSRVRIVPVKTVTGEGAIRTTFFEFDGVLFPEIIPEEVIIRSILKISGVDPRIDIADYVGSIKTHVRTDDATAKQIITLLGRVSKSAIKLEVSTRDEIMSRITGIGSKILWKRLDDVSLGAMHIDTLKSWSVRSGPQIRLTKIPVFARGGSRREITQFVFVDPAILNEPLHIPDTSDMVKLINTEAVKRQRVSQNTYTHAMWKELEEVSKECQLQWWGIGAREKRKYIQWVFEYGVHSTVAEDHHLEVVEAIRIGHFNSTDELISYLSSPDP
jgi:hypothetical protein